MSIQCVYMKIIHHTQRFFAFLAVYPHTLQWSIYLYLRKHPSVKVRVRTKGMDIQFYMRNS